MGNSSSSTNEKELNNQYNFYDSQLNEYKRMILAQQEQSNQLSKMKGEFVSLMINLVSMISTFYLPNFKAVWEL